MYGNSRENGHIELEVDLNNGNFTDSSGQYDKDPKVSGKITIEGTAHDNVLLMELGVKTNTTFGTTKTFGDTVYTQIANRKTDGSWESQGTLAANGWEFEAVKETNLQKNNEETKEKAGNTLKWKLHLDTQKVSTTAFADFIVQLQAIDRGSATLADDGNVTYAAGNVSTQSDTQTTTEALTNFYKMDIVPYITDVETMLWHKKKQNQSVYSRTAKGHYPVASDETITLIGFNLSATHYSTNNTSDYRTIKEVAASSSLTTGEYNEAIVTYTVDDKTVSLAALNNKNSNDAVGKAKNAKLEDKYNMQPNGDTNDTLTDDIFFDVWEIKKHAAQANSGKIKEPVMRINPSNGMIGFAFANGADLFNMPNGTNASTTVWQKNFANYSGINFEYGSDGRAHSLSTGLDTEPNSGYGGRLQYINSAWGGNGAGNMYNWNTNVTVPLDCVGVPSGTYLEGVRQGANLIDIERFSSPSIAVAGTNRVYIAYFDRFNKQIRFVYGTSDVTNNGGKSVDGLLNSRTASNGNINNDTNADASNYGSHSIYESSNASYSVVAGVEYNNNGGGKADTGNVAGEHLSIAVIPGANQAGDVVVFVWYDGTNLNYTFRYGTKDDTDANAVGVANKWSETKQIFTDGIGEHCAVTVDANGGIHIAAYSRSGADLYYAYIAKTNPAQTPTSWADPKTCLVDSYSQVGKYISIDAAKLSADGKIIPYISYFAEGFNGLPKVAYLPDGVDSTTSLLDGSDINTDLFTGNWEMSLIPTTSYVCEDNMNVAVWKNNGVITTSTEKPDSDTGNNVYGNGTSQFVLGYATEEGVNGYIETAQLKNPQPATN